MKSAEKEMAPYRGANQRQDYRNYDHNIQLDISGKAFIATLTKKLQAFLGQHHLNLVASKEGSNE